MSKIIKRLIVLLFYVTSLFCLGCGDVEWLWGESKPGRQGRSAGVIQPTQKPESNNSQTSTKTSKQQPAGMSEESQEQAIYYQLILHSKPAQVRTRPGIKHVILRKASARAAGEMLGIMYVPAGPTGTEHRYTLIYATKAEWGAAASWIEALDVQGIAVIIEQSGNSNENEFAYGVGIINGIQADVLDEDKRFRMAREVFSRSARRAEQAEHLRWASGMIAGSISAGRLHEYEQAEKDYATAEAAARPGSLEQMNAQYARACMLIQNGKGEAARKMLANLIGQFGDFKKTEVYERAGRTLATLN